jgi:hypothetical protein
MNERRWIGLVQGLVSGPLLATLILFLPFGLLTLLVALWDPPPGVFRAVLFWVSVPAWSLLALLIAVANIRIVLLGIPERAFSIRTGQFMDDDSGRDNLNGIPGRMLARALMAHLAGQPGRPPSFSEIIAEDYGWGFWVSEDGDGYPLWVAVSHAGRDVADEGETYVVSVNAEPPVLPWRRLCYRVNRRLFDGVDRGIRSYFESRGIVWEAEG